MNTLTREEFVQIYGQQELAKFEPLTSIPRTGAQDFGIGIAKGAASSVKAGGDVIQSALKATPIGRVPGVGTAIQQAGDLIQGKAGLTDQNLTASNNAQLAGKATEFAAEFASPFVIGRLANLASKATTAAKAATATSPTGLIKRGTAAVSDFLKDPKLALAKQNVSPQLETSANRYLDGTKRLADPLTTYEADLAQSKKALTDIKVDPAISTVGEEIGDSFKAVISQRRKVGETMGDELKKTATKPVSLKGTLPSFQRELLDNGVTYDAVERKVLSGNTSKFADADINIVEYYAKELQKMSSSPTMAQLDAFVSRIPKEIDGLKAARNITSKTNAERIIANHLGTLRDELVKNGTKEYAAARKSYSDLSGFIDEGAGFLGKITQDGDFAKDAALAKSSVQSILNQGKKDWLEKLEAHTGYPALDRSVIALQAMKDAGDFRGLSLLEELSKGTPTSPSGVTQKAIDFAMAKVGRVVGGTPEEQTRAFLQALKEGAVKNGSTNAAFGAAAGINPDTQEFDPTAAAVGIGSAALGIKLTKGSEPMNVAKKLTAGQYKALKEFAAIRTKTISEIPYKVFEKLDNTLEPLKVDTSKFTLKELDDYIASIIQAYEDSI